MEQQLDENHIIAERRQKLTEIKAATIAYPNTFTPKDSAAQLHTNYAAHTHDELAASNVAATIAGRIMLKRVMGKASFVTIKDDGTNIQIYVARDKVGEDKYANFKRMDIGDIIGIAGKLFKTKTNELTIEATSLELISKCIRPLPEKFHGLTDQELRYRQRYVDLIMNDDTRNIFITRSKIINSIRTFMLNEKYLEVETPMLHPIPGGATAKPFTTHHNALDMELFLRIAPELYLKRLIVGGIPRVFEINRNFRNEGLSTRHNPEFTMIEFYESYANHIRMMEITEEILRKVAQDTLGSYSFEYQGQQIDFEPKFERLTLVNAIAKYNPHYNIADLQNREFLLQEVAKFTKNTPTTSSTGVLQLSLFEETTETKLWQPTFIIDYPVDASPLARQSDTDPTLTERFELFIVGRELANGYSELNDPEIQAQRFQQQVAEKAAGSDEAMHYDADYIRALEYGMPHTGGCGIGIDRLTMLITNSASIRDVILFPQMRNDASN